MYKYKTDAERYFAATVRWSRNGNKYRRKTRSAGERRAMECGCGCNMHGGGYVFDARPELLDKIHSDEINYWRECL